MPILNSVEKKAIPAILARYSPGCLFLGIYLATLSWLVVSVVTLIRNQQPSSGDHRNWTLLAEQLESIKAHIDITDGVVRRLRDDMGRVEQNSTQLIQGNQQVQGQIEQLKQSSSGSPDLNNQVKELLSQDLKQQEVQQTELRNTLRQLAQKQADLVDKLDGIKSVIRRGNLLVPEVPLAPEPGKPGDGNNAPEK